MNENHLAQTDTLVRSAKNRDGIRSILRLRGKWHVQHGRWSEAIDSLSEAIEMARAVGQSAPEPEALLALAKIKLNMLPNARQQAEQLAAAGSINHQAIAELWLAIGDSAQAEKHAVAAYEQGWADGEPYVFRYELNKAIDLLNKLGVEIPKLPAYDPAKDKKLPWEDELVAAIEGLRAEKRKKEERDQ